MKYCVRSDKFEFNPTKVASVVDAYYTQDGNNAKVLALFDTLEDAKDHINSLTPVLRLYKWDLAYAEVYMITECDWYFDDEYYRDDETGETERTFADLELFDDIVFKADEERFNEVVSR